MEHADNKPTNSSRIVFLDYLRIFAFVSVLIGHKFYAAVVDLSNDRTVHATPRFIADVLLPLVSGGGAGVVVFFLVSGYIITHVLQTERTGEFLRAIVESGVRAELCDVS
jgi:peptidoglycan/LPS O-acetylase OafA/YrhL